MKPAELLPLAIALGVAALGASMVWDSMDVYEPPITQPRDQTPYVIPTPEPTATLVAFAPHGSPAPMALVRQNLEHMGIPTAGAPVGMR